MNYYWSAICFSCVCV